MTAACTRNLGGTEVCGSALSAAGAAEGVDICQELHGDAVQPPHGGTADTLRTHLSHSLQALTHGAGTHLNADLQAGVVRCSMERVRLYSPVTCQSRTNPKYRNESSSVFREEVLVALLHSYTSAPPSLDSFTLCGTQPTTCHHFD